MSHLIDPLNTSDQTIPTMISVDICNRIIVWHFEEQKGVPEIAQLAGCSESAVYKILALYREYGQVTNPHARPHDRPHALDMTVLNYMSALLDANPTLYLDELQEKIFDVHNVDVHISIIS